MKSEGSSAGSIIQVAESERMGAIGKEAEKVHRVEDGTAKYASSVGFVSSRKPRRFIYVVVRSRLTHPSLNTTTESRLGRS